jgi:hypothetical protein
VEPAIVPRVAPPAVKLPNLPAGKQKEGPILGGPFAGETILRDGRTGSLAHQGSVYVPID